MKNVCNIRSRGKKVVSNGRGASIFLVREEAYRRKGFCGEEVKGRGKGEEIDLIRDREEKKMRVIDKEEIKYHGLTNREENAECFRREQRNG